MSPSSSARRWPAKIARKVARKAKRVLVPGGHMLVAGNPLLSSTVFAAMEQEGFEKRGEVIRLTQTLRGGDRPKGAEAECGARCVGGGFVAGAWAGVDGGG